jgi:hypothetical protein
MTDDAVAPTFARLCGRPRPDQALHQGSRTGAVAKAPTLLDEFRGQPGRAGDGLGDNFRRMSLAQRRVSGGSKQTRAPGLER